MRPMQEPALPQSVAEVDVDDFDGVVPDRLDADSIRRLSRLRPLVSSLHIAMEWLLILASAAACWHFWHPALYVSTIAFIGARQHALIILAHDAAHYRLSRSRWLNDCAGELLLAWPFLLFTMRAYRRNHFPHHRHVNTERDPDWSRKQTRDWEFPKTRLELTKMLLMDVTGLGFINFVITAMKLPASSAEASNDGQRWFALGRLTFFAALAAGLTIYKLWVPYLLFWVIPYVTWMQLCFHIRSIAEHFAIRDRTGVFAQTRTVIPTWFDRVFILSKNVNFHLEHHLYPSVPFYDLPQLHKELMSRPAYRNQAHVTKGYLNVLRECMMSDR
jgi:fatty acid desaturase